MQPPGPPSMFPSSLPIEPSTGPGTPPTSGTDTMPPGANYNSIHHTPPGGGMNHPPPIMHNMGPPYNHHITNGWPDTTQDMDGYIKTEGYDHVTEECYVKTPKKRGRKPKYIKLMENG